MIQKSPFFFLLLLPMALFFALSVDHESLFLFNSVSFSPLYFSSFLFMTEHERLRSSYKLFSFALNSCTHT